MLPRHCVLDTQSSVDTLTAPLWLSHQVRHDGGFGVLMKINLRFLNLNIVKLGNIKRVNVGY